jgi:hypothetical protein
MSVQPMDFYGELLLLGKKNRAYGAPAVLAEMTAISTALTTDPTTRDVTIQLPPAPVKPDPSQTDFTNAALLLVNKGKGGNLPNATMKAAIDAALTLIGPPTVTAAPVVTGTGIIGNTLSSTTGTWTNSPTSYSYQWQRGGANIAGATNPTYTLVQADGGTSVGCLVTASNNTGSASAHSNTIAVQGVPVIVTAPAVTGGTTGGSVLTSSNGTWTNNPTSYTYSWQRNNTPDPGVTTPTLTTTAADDGAGFRCLVTAHNVAGASVAAVTLYFCMGPPFFTTPPVISGSAVQGAQLSITNIGVNSSGNLGTIARQWQRDGVAIAGIGNVTTYTTVAADLGAMITCAVTATTTGAGAPGASAPSMSNAIGPITATSTGEDPDYIAPMPTIPRVQQRIRAREAARQERRP